MSGYDFNDIKQELVIIAIDGIRSYDPDKNVKLSTFLHVHLRNKLISKIRSKNKISNDACAVKDMSSYNDEDARKSVRSEINFSQISTLRSSSDDEHYSNFIEAVGNENSMYFVRDDSYDRSDFLSALDRLSKHIDSKTSKIIELVCLNDYSIKDAAAEVGLSGWAASMRLKNLNKNSIIRDIFNKKF
tara:strand:+ start:29 stop:592 length:564 start_codon:yes stop_codon:yes gene_type:complete